MAGAPEPHAPGAAPVPAAPILVATPVADQVSVVAHTDDGAGNTAIIETDTSNRSWVGSLFAKGDMSVDSLIVAMICSVIAYWVLCAYQIIVTGHEITSPGMLGTGFAAMLAAFATGKTVRDRYGQQPPGG